MTIQEKAKLIKKEHFIKLGLWIAGVGLTIIWLAFLIATSISTGAKYIYSEAVEITSREQFDALVGNGYQIFIKEQKVYAHSLLATYDWNPLCLTYKPTLTGWYLLVVLAPVGYLGIIYIIAYMKNMVTPGYIKKTVRKGLQFGYVKQKEVDYIVERIDINIGLKRENIKKDNEEDN